MPSPYVALVGTSNTRQFDGFGSINIKSKGKYVPQPYHTVDHQCCLVGGHTGDAVKYRNNIVNLKVASYPGLSLENWTRKRVLAGPHEGQTMCKFISHVCQDSQFSGTLAMFLLCNDSAFFMDHEEPTAAVRKYLDRIEGFLGVIEGIGAVEFLILNTALMRQSDFLDDSLYHRKATFNRCFVDNQHKLGFKICINGNNLPYTVIDTNTFLPEKELNQAKFYCQKEVNSKYRHHNCVHIRASYMEQYLHEIKSAKGAFFKSRNKHLKRQRKLVINLSYLFGQMDIDKP